MKTALALLVLTALTQTAAADCLGEAQMIAKVSSILRKTPTSCTVAIEPNSIRFYNVNLLCPLDFSEVLYRGVEVSATSDVCAFQPNQDISGVVVLNKDGKIVLE